MKRIILVMLVIGFLPISEGLYSQRKHQNQLMPKSQEKHKDIKNLPDANFLIENISINIAEGNIDQLSNYFSKQVYVSLKTGERGFYSNNQSYYVVQNFMRIYEPLSFQLTSKLTESVSPYLAGKLICRHKGSIETCQVYISLSWNGVNWEISQITIN